ncbi:MAG: hypothetical protein NVSMB33_16160 [Ktedonobacteraceae bacterium]
MIMNRQRRILIVDDLEAWREELVEMLQSVGFQADSASSITQALERLDESLYHLLVLDIRMDESDPGNRDGIDLLRELVNRGLSEAIKVIILSNYETPELVYLAFKDYKVTDFLYKREYTLLSKDAFSKQKFLEIVQQIFDRDMNINLALDVNWQEVSGPEQVVLNLEVDGTRVKRNTALQSRIALELDDLLCRLFHQAKSVLVRPLTSGQSGAGVLLAQALYTTGGGRALVVKFGDFRKIDEEYSNFKNYVQSFVGGGRNTSVLDDPRRTPHLGGIKYSLLGASNDPLEDFGSFYGHANVSQVTDALDGLFNDTCKAWYASLSQLQPLDLTTDYQQLLGFTSENLEKAVYERLKSVQGKQKLHFRSLNEERTFTNPLLVMTGPHQVRFTYICTTHGDFNQHNIFIDTTHHNWLIDFQRTGQGHILRDVTKLDSEVRFQLLTDEEATLKERLQMEEILCNIGQFSEVDDLATRLPTTNQALAKAYTTVVHLLTLAKGLVAPNPGNDISEYYIALFYNAMNTLRFYTLSSTQREHALLCASLLADRLRLRG